MVRLERFVGGGQVIGTLASGKKLFVWGGLPGETVQARIIKQKTGFAEGVVEAVLEASADRVAPLDPDSYLSTSPWQILEFAAEQEVKAGLIQEAFALHHLRLPNEVEVYSDHRQYGYRNKVEFSWWWDTEANQLDLAFFRRGGHGKTPVAGTSLAPVAINRLARELRDYLRSRQVEARSLKSLLIRTDQRGQAVWQLYAKTEVPDIILPEAAAHLPAQGGEVIYSDPRSPASRITTRLARYGSTNLQDDILGAPFRYAAESFFQVNVPVYEQALKDMQARADAGPLLDLYSGVGSIGLSLGKTPLTLLEIDEHAYQELEQNIKLQGREATAEAIHAPAEKALEHIKGDATVIVDPPRAGLHAAVTERLLAALPRRVLYLSCNPVTQARDVALLASAYAVTYHRGYNFFPRTPHIEHLVVLDRR